jgi:hypothetical protein
LPIKKNTRRDEWQAPILDDMVAWRVPIKKATVHVETHGITVRLSYRALVPLPRMGERVATLGPITREGRLLLRTETQTKDYTSKLATMTDRKDRWDLIRRRAMRQIGRRHGHARIKRERLAHLSPENWTHSYVHEWTRQIVDWCASQGVGTIRVESLETKDWPAYKFARQLEYKCADAGIMFAEGADIREASGYRSARAAIAKTGKDIKKRREAVRELTHQIGESQ